MKRVAVTCVMLLVLGVSTQAYGYVLVYNLFGAVPTVDTETDTGDTKFVNGVMILNIDEETGACEESSIVLYGREGWRSRVYTIYDDIVELARYGNYVTVMADTGTGDNIILTGRTSARTMGLPSRVRAANSLSGGISLEWGQLFDLEESLVGAGAMQARLDRWRTRSANFSSADGIDETVDSVIASLESRGYQFLGEEEEPPDDEPGDEEPPLLR